MVTHLRASSWQAPLNFVEASDEEPAPTGCESLDLKHSISVSPTESRANTPSGFDIGLDVPQSDVADGVGTPPLRRVSVDFPAGVALSPTVADGLAGCSDAQLHAGSDLAPECPDAAKVGSVTVDTPLLAKDLTGSVYVGTSTATETFRVFLVLEGPGVLLKIPGKVEPDPATGQLKATFDNLPELPFSSMQMHLKGGSNAALATPGCGKFTTTSELTAWSGQISKDTSTMSIDSGCEEAGKFEPSLSAGLTNPVAGGPTAFSLRLTRPTGQQAISTLDVSLPPGVLAKVGSVPLCPEAQAAAGTCSAASKIGTTTVGAGDGTSPVFVPQPGKAPTAVYLAGPYKGAPLSLAVVVPARAGPFDLGTRGRALGLRRRSRHRPGHASSPIRCRRSSRASRSVHDIRVDIDRPGFTVNPTNCKPIRSTATITSARGLGAHPSSRFQIANCGDLGVQADARAEPLGRHQAHRTPGAESGTHRPTGRSQHRLGRSHPAEVRVPRERPHRDGLHPRPVRRECLPGELDLRLRQSLEPAAGPPLQGPVYLRSTSHKLPDLVAALDGPIHIDSGRADRLGRRPDPQHVRSRARRPGLQVRAGNAGRREGPFGQQPQPL